MAPQDPTILAAVFDATAEALLIADDDRRFVAANGAAGQLLGRPLDEILTVRIDDILAHEGRERFRSMWPRSSPTAPCRA